MIAPQDCAIQETNEKCFVCERNKQTSGKLHSSGVWTTLVGYGGHDDNCKIESFTCTEGHKYSIRKRNICSSCSWKGHEDCFCSVLGVTIHYEGTTKDESVYVYAESPVDFCALKGVSNEKKG